MAEDFFKKKENLGFDLLLVFILPPAGDTGLTVNSDKQLGKMKSDTKGCLFQHLVAAHMPPVCPVSLNVCTGLSISIINLVVVAKMKI